MARAVRFRTADLNGALTEGSTNFDPERFLDPDDASSGLTAAAPFLAQNNFSSAIIRAFALPSDDAYVYHAVASVTLAQVQAAVNAGAANGLHAWYGSADGAASPPTADINAYTDAFRPSIAPGPALASLAANAKKGSQRKAVGDYLLSRRFVDTDFPNPKKRKNSTASPAPNPAWDFWAWSCHALEWAGPTVDTVRVKMAHHILPVLMHHFGCVAPSQEALHMLATLAGAERGILEIGSGNGYWTMLLRRHGLAVTAIDNQQSLYRTMWIDDTIREDGCRWLSRNQGAKDQVLLLVYPITAGNWTASVLRAYKGHRICIVGTQNDNRYTAFSDDTVENWMKREKPQFAKKVQIPLPSFAGKDEAMFIYMRAET